MVRQEPKRALNDREAALYISMSTSFLRQARVNGDRDGRTDGPRFIRIGRAVRYLREDLDAWLEDHRTERTAGGESCA